MWEVCWPTSRGPKILGTKRLLRTRPGAFLCHGTSLCLEDTETAQYAELENKGEDELEWKLLPICSRKYKYSDPHWATDIGRLFSFLNWTERNKIIDVEE